MTDRQKKEHIDALLHKGICRAEAFRLLGLRLRSGQITCSDYLSLSDALGFPLTFEEENTIIGDLMDMDLSEGLELLPGVLKRISQA